MMRRILILCIVCLCGLGVMAQSDRQFVRSGNRAYRVQQYAKAQSEYMKALEKKNDNPQALYNLGCALMMQQKDSMAVSMFEKAVQVEKSKARKAMAYHNMGVICQNHRMYGEAMKAYAESLRNNPHDDATRYNYVLCKRLLKNQKKNGGGSNDKKNDKNQDKKEQQKKQNSDQKQQQQQQNNENNQKQMSKDNAEQLLNAVMQEEQNTQQKLKKAAQQRQTRQLQKNW